MRSYRYLLDKWDWIIYRLAQHSLRRICQSHGGFGYLMELWIREWRSQYELTPELKAATERCFESLRDHQK